MIQTISVEGYLGHRDFIMYICFSFWKCKKKSFDVLNQSESIQVSKIVSEILFEHTQQGMVNKCSLCVFSMLIESKLIIFFLFARLFKLQQFF